MAATKPRLRFDKVALGLMQRVRTSVGPDAPPQLGVVFAVTAPIRQAGRTAEALIARIRRALAEGARGEWREDLFGNRVRVRIVARSDPAAEAVVGFVHNPEPDPAALLDEAEAKLGGPNEGSGPPAG